MANCGGYDCNFIEDTPQLLKLYECPICLLVLKDPHIVDCCGRKYCKLCIEQIKEAGKPCPVCAQPFTVCLLEKELQRKIGDLRVYCGMNKEGCEWIGELRELDVHTQDHCIHVVMECTLGCGACIKRKELKTHELDSCPKRSLEVQFASITNKFEARIALLENVCKQCQEKLGKQHQVIQKQEETIKNLREKINKQDEEIEVLRSNKILPHFSLCLNALSEYWYSPPFYSHSLGYKLRIVVRAALPFIGKMYRVLCYLELLPGEYDDLLTWPVNITLITNVVCHQENQESDTGMSLEIKKAVKPIDAMKIQTSASELLREVSLNRLSLVTAPVHYYSVNYSADLAVIGVTISGCPEEQ